MASLKPSEPSAATLWLRVHLCDGSWRTLELGAAARVQEAVLAMTAKMGLPDACARWLGLALVPTGGGAGARRGALAGAGEPAAALDERCARVVLRVALLSEACLACREPGLLHLRFLQAAEEVTQGALPCEDEAQLARLAALHLRKRFGPRVEAVHGAQFVMDHLLELLPLDSVRAKRPAKWADAVLREYDHLERCDPVAEYLASAEALELYGTTCFRMRVLSAPSAGLVGSRALLGVSRKGVAVLEEDALEERLRCGWRDIYSWGLRYEAGGGEAEDEDEDEDKDEERERDVLFLRLADSRGNRTSGELRVATLGLGDQVVDLLTAMATVVAEEADEARAQPKHRASSSGPARANPSVGQLRASVARSVAATEDRDGPAGRRAAPPVPSRASGDDARDARAGPPVGPSSSSRTAREPSQDSAAEEEGDEEQEVDQEQEQEPAGEEPAEDEEQDDESPTDTPLAPRGAAPIRGRQAEEGEQRSEPHSETRAEPHAEPPEQEDSEERAAVKLQSLTRGVLTRRWFDDRMDAATTHASAWRRCAAVKQAASLQLQQWTVRPSRGSSAVSSSAPPPRAWRSGSAASAASARSAATSVQSSASEAARRVTEPPFAGVSQQEQDAAAVLIQSTVRGHQQRDKLSRMEQAFAAVYIQTAARGFLGRRRAEAERAKAASSSSRDKRSSERSSTGTPNEIERQARAKSGGWSPLEAAASITPPPGLDRPRSSPIGMIRSPQHPPPPLVPPPGLGLGLGLGTTAAAAKPAPLPPANVHLIVPPPAPPAVPAPRAPPPQHARVGRGESIGSSISARRPSASAASVKSGDSSSVLLPSPPGSPPPEKPRLFTLPRPPSIPPPPPDMDLPDEEEEEDDEDGSEYRV